MAALDPAEGSVLGWGPRRWAGGPLAGRLEGPHRVQVGLLPHGSGPGGWLLANRGQPCSGFLAPHGGGVVGRKGPSRGVAVGRGGATWEDLGQ